MEPYLNLGLWSGQAYTIIFLQISSNDNDFEHGNVDDDGDGDGAKFEPETLTWSGLY